MPHAWPVTEAAPPNSLTFALAGGAIAHSTAPRPPLVPLAAPEQAHLSIIMASIMPCAPAKPHLHHAYAPGFAHRSPPDAPTESKKGPSGSSRKRSPTEIFMRQTLPGTASASRRRVTEKAHLGWQRRVERFLNPLTFCPADAHWRPRTSSRVRPADPHHVSRKASPHRLRRLIAKGFGLALTFFNKVQGCLLQLLSRTCCGAWTYVPIIQTTARRETKRIEPEIRHFS